MAVKKKAAVKKAPAKKVARKKAAKLDEHGLSSKDREVADLFRGGPDDIRGNAKLCYKAVFPRCKLSTAETEGPKLLRKPQIQAYLDAKAKEVAEKADITLERVLREIGRVGLFDPRKLFDEDGNPLPIHQLDDDTAAAISGIRVRRDVHGDDDDESSVIEYKVADKNAALEKLMKHLGAYEKDNRQKVDPLVAMLERINGSALKPVDE